MVAIGVLVGIDGVDVDEEVELIGVFTLFVVKMVVKVGVWVGVGVAGVLVEVDIIIGTAVDDINFVEVDNVVAGTKVDVVKVDGAWVFIEAVVKIVVKSVDFIGVDVGRLGSELDGDKLAVEAFNSSNICRSSVVLYPFPRSALVTIFGVVVVITGVVVDLLVEVGVVVVEEELVGSG